MRPNRPPRQFSPKRHYSPALVRPPRTRVRRNRLPEWRPWLPPALARAVVAIAVGATPRLEPRFDDAALTVVCLAVAALVCSIVYIAVKLGAATTRAVLMPDPLVLVVLVPVLSIGSSILMSSGDAGGQTRSFAMAAVVLLGALVTAGGVLVATSSDLPDVAATAMLPGPLMMAAVLSSERYGAGAMSDGLSLAWMVAAGLTLLAGFADHSVRQFLPAFGVVAVAFGVGLLPGRSSQGAEIASGSLALAWVAIGVAGLLTIVVPEIARRVGASNMRQGAGPAMRQDGD